MTVFIQQAAKGIFHGAGGGCENVGFNGREVDDILADKPFGNHEAIWIYLVEAEELICNIADGFTHIDPRLVTLIKMDITKAMRLDDVEVLVFPFSEVGIDHHGTVMAGMDIRGRIAILFHGTDYAIQLPGGGGAARVEKMPADIDFQGGIGGFGDDLLIASQIHDAVIISQRGGGRCPENGDL